MVTELAKCQAQHRNGYLSAFPPELFDRLRDGVKGWAPFYTFHKWAKCSPTSTASRARNGKFLRTRTATAGELARTGGRKAGIPGYFVKSNRGICSFVEHFA
jgi:hypothetical protein